jgi:hypothetical protein
VGLFDWLGRGRQSEPLTGGDHHGGWQVARAELTEKMFSRVGQYTPAGEA